MAAKVNDVMERKEAKKRGCPFHTNKATVMAKSWWPESLNLRTLPGAPPASAKSTFHSKRLGDCFALYGTKWLTCELTSPVLTRHDTT